MRSKTTTIPDLVMNVLQSALISKTGVQLQGQIERNDYAKVNKVLEACGCKWNRKAKQHDFQNEQAREKILAAIDGGSYVQEKSAYDFFPTPDVVSDELAENLNIRSGNVILEPSAGRGALIDAIERTGFRFHRIVAIDLNPNDVAHLKKNYSEEIQIMEKDFMKCDPFGVVFDAIIMNPPFSNGQDVEHVVHAMRFLKRGGRCGCIVSPGYTFREGKKWDLFRAMLDANEVILEKELPSGTFKAAGTMIRTRMIVIEKS